MCKILLHFERFQIILIYEILFESGDIDIFTASNEVGQGYVFVGMCDSVHRGVSAVAQLKRKAWYLDTRGFILKKIQWHIHAGSWSLVNCWREALMRHYIRCS